MKKFFILITFLFVIQNSFAEIISIESICNGLGKNKITKGNFSQEKTINKTKRTFKSNGKFIICDQGIIWTTEKPFFSNLILSSDSMIQISSDGTKKIIDAKNNEVFKNISSTLLSVFSNDILNLSNNFNISFNSDKNNFWNIELRPKDKTIASFMSSIIICGKINLKIPEILEIKLNEADGSNVVYKFLNQSYPKELLLDEKELFNIK